MSASEHKWHENSRVQHGNTSKVSPTSSKSNSPQLALDTRLPRYQLEDPGAVKQSLVRHVPSPAAALKTDTARQDSFNASSTSARARDMKQTRVGAHEIERWTSTRRYMAQLSDDDDDDEDEEEDEERIRFAQDHQIDEDDEVEEDDRDRRQCATDAGSRSEPAGPRRDIEDYGSKNGAQKISAVADPMGQRDIDHQPTLTDYASNIEGSPLDESEPIVRIGPPSPGTEASSLDPFGPAQWDGLTSPTAADSQFKPESPRAWPTANPGPTAPRNFSRPFRGPPPSESFQEPNQHHRLSIDSSEPHTNMERSSSLGHSSAAHSSNLEHSSQGAHSMSGSWDERRQLEFGSYAAAREAARAGMASSRSGHVEELSERMERVRAFDGDSTGYTEHARPALDPPSAPPRSSSFSSPSKTAEIPNSFRDLPLDRGQTAESSRYGGSQNLLSPTLSAHAPKAVSSTPTALRDSRLRMPGIRTADNSPQAAQNGFHAAPSRDSPSAPSFINSPPKERRGAWARFRSRSKSRSSKGPPSPTEPRFNSFSAASTYSDSSSGAPAVTFDPPRRPLGDLDDLAARARELTERRRRFDELKLQPSVARSVQAGFVHAGEAGVAPAWLAVKAEGDTIDVDHRNLLQPPPTSSRPPNMQRSVSEQGSPELRLNGNARDGLRTPSQTQSLHSSYSQNSAMTVRSISDLQTPPRFGGHQQTPSGPALETLRKAKSGLHEHGTLGLGRSHAQEADEYLRLGIEYHENGELSRAAWCFEQSAKRGASSGMLMFGLTLQHGWGCRVDMPLGFRYLQSAAESVVEELNQVLASNDEKATAGGTERLVRALQNELVLALHELGQSCRFGYGCDKDPAMAVSYFQLAADLGDPDAQNDLAFMYANGKGCKKNMKLAAKYYRMAIKQGMSDMGLSWVWKPKYD